MIVSGSITECRATMLIHSMHIGSLRRRKDGLLMQPASLMYWYPYPLHAHTCEHYRRCDRRRHSHPHHYAVSSASLPTLLKPTTASPLSKHCYIWRGVIRLNTVRFFWGGIDWPTEWTLWYWYRVVKTYQYCAFIVGDINKNMFTF